MKYKAELTKSMKKIMTKQLITQALKESREGEGTLSLRVIAEILKEVLSKEEIAVLIVHLQRERITRKI